MDVIQNKSSESELNESSTGQSWPIVRNNYQKLAFDSYKSDDHVKAVLYDTKALSCGYAGTLLNGDAPKQIINQKTIAKTIHLQQDSGNDLIDYLSACVNHITIDETADKISTTNDQLQFNELCAKCAQLPKQWTVVQLSQMYKGYNSYSTKEDMYTSDAPIKITMFRDSMSEKRDNRPVPIVLDWIDEKKILSACYDVHNVYYKDYVSAMNTANYAAFMKNLTQMQSKLVIDMTLWLGPWITLFSGKIKTAAGEEFEKNICDEVDGFCSEHDDMHEDKQTVLHLMARRIDLLTSDYIKQAAQDLSRNELECKQIIKFLANLKKKIKPNVFEYYPCILVIDEILDPLPWEMILTTQELSRVHSIYSLFDLYDRFKDKIDDGYLKVNIENGFCMINPDDDEKLGDMLRRMNKYYDDSFPNWKRIAKKTPTLAETVDGFANSDLFVYSGHGSSLQFFRSTEFEEMKHNCVMMLFGCESIAMKPRGAICEASCTSYTYLKAGCPGVLGSITIVTDIWVDLITILMLTQWIAPKQIKHPTIDTCSDEHSKERVRRILQNYDGKRNPNLLQVLCDVRNENGISIRMRSAMIFRGLPPYNTSLGK